MQRRVGGEKLRCATRMHFETQSGRFEKIRLADAIDHFLVVTSPRTKERVAKAARCFENRRVGGEAMLREQRRFDSVTCGVAGVKGLYHGALLAMNAAGGRCGDAERRFQLCRIQLEQTYTGYSGSEAAPDRRTVKAAILHIGAM